MPTTMARDIAHKPKPDQQSIIVLLKRPISIMVAAIIMHMPGLWVKIQFEDMKQYINSMLAAITEGSFLLLLMQLICCAGCNMNKLLWTHCSVVVYGCHLAVSALIGSFGAGFIGEHVIGKMYVRLAAFSPQVLSTASYIYYPSRLVQDTTTLERLRRNTQKLTTTLDLFPTIQSILHGGTPPKEDNLTEGCMTGIDLAAVEIRDDRVVVASNSVSTKKKYHLWALMAKESALYHRLQKGSLVGQGPNNTYVMSFKECEERSCFSELDEPGKDQFRTAIATFKNDTSIRDEVKESDLVNFFERLVNY